MRAEIVSLDARRRAPRPTVHWQATIDGSVELAVRFADGTEGVVRMSAEQAALSILQGTDAVELAGELRRR